MQKIRSNVPRILSSHRAFIHAVFCYNTLVKIKTIISIFFNRLVCNFLVIKYFQRDLIINLHRRSCIVVCHILGKTRKLSRHTVEIFPRIRLQYNHFYGKKFLNPNGQTNRCVNVMTLTFAFYSFANNFNNTLKICRSAAIILSSLQSEIVSIRNTKTSPPLAETVDLLSESHEKNFRLKFRYSQFEWRIVW